MVPLVEDYKLMTPFPKLPSMIISATILGFFGTTDEVCPMLQNLSHTSRAYIVKQNALPGFVSEMRPRLLY